MQQSLPIPLPMSSSIWNPLQYTGTISSISWWKMQLLHLLTVKFLSLTLSRSIRLKNPIMPDILLLPRKNSGSLMFYVLFKKYSFFTQEKVFSDTFSITALAVYDEFESAKELAYMGLQELTAFIMKKWKNRFPDSNAVVKAIQKAARSSYHLPNIVSDSANQVLAISITFIKGIGSVYSAGIIAEIGGINRFDNHAQLAKYAVLAWTQYQSGKYEAQTPRPIKSGNRFLRYYQCEVAFSLIRCNAEYSRFYHLKYKEVNRYQHKRTLALTARKLCGWSFDCWKPIVYIVR